MKTEASPVKPGDIIAGKYRVDRILGQGGMGVVVAATHLELREVRALKCLLASTLKKDENIERFRREARTVLRLKSEHVARVLDVGKLENGAPFMVMEYLHGSDLGEALKQLGPFSLENAILYVLQAMDAVAEAHAKGIIHRDLKPANLFLTRLPGGMPCVKVLDFGISKIAKESSEDADMTNTSAVLGSPQFMSPEQMRATRDVDVRTDIWALGVILYQLTTGKLPFRGRSSTEIIANMFSSQPEPPSRLKPQLPPAFDDIALRCLRLDPAERFATVAELAVALAPLAPSAASFTLERIARYATANNHQKTGSFSLVDGTGSVEDFLTPSPQLAGTGANPSETISSAPTRVLHGAAISSETISSALTNVLHAAPNQFSVEGVGLTEVMDAPPKKGPSEFSSAKTNVLGPPPKQDHQRSKTEVMPQSLRQTVTSEARAALSTSSPSTLETQSSPNGSSPGNRMRYIVAGAVISIIAVVIAAIAVSSSGGGTVPRNKLAPPASPVIPSR